MKTVHKASALADISRSALCCHSNDTHASIANPPHSAQLDGTRYHWLLDNSRISQLADCQLADWTTRGLDISRTGQLAD